MDLDISTPVAELSDEALAELISAGTAVLNDFAGLGDPTDEQITDTEAAYARVEEAKGEVTARAEAATARAERVAALRAKTTPEEPEPDKPSAEVAVVEAAEKVIEGTIVEDAVVPVNVATLASRTTRPTVPDRARGQVVITAAADVPEFATGSRIEDVAGVAKAMINRMKGFPTPTGDPQGQMHQYGVAMFRKPTDDSLVADGRDDYDTIMRASRETRLSGGSLTAAGGWCAPSEILYDLCYDESTDGLLDIPEVQVNRGGIKFTKGPSFADIYTNVGFCQTEAQAIAGTAKPCYEVPCPPFTEVRLDACGLCIKAPLLTNAAYPELVQRYITGGLVAHQHKISAKVINAIGTALGTTVTATDLKSTTSSTLSVVEIIVESLRTKFRLGFNATMEVLAPRWLLAAIRADLAQRGGVDLLSVTDQQINAHFAVRGVRVQWLYNFQDLAATCPTEFPATAVLYVYPAGAFVKGTSDVISLNAVYDAASLATNMYTALFFEEGILVANTCFDGCKVTVPVCSAGTVGAASNADCLVAP